MRTATAGLLSLSCVALGMFAASWGPTAHAGPNDVIVGPIVGECTDFREKSKTIGNEIYRNASQARVAVTVMFECGTDTATLQREDPRDKFVQVWKAPARTVDRQKSVTVDVGPGGSLWLKSDGGTARWQIVGVSPQ